MHAIMTNCMLSVRHHYNTTPVTPCMFSLKCLLTALLRLNRRSHKPQENCLYSECTGRCSLDSVAVQKRFGYSLQAYGFTASCRWICCTIAAEILLTNVTNEPGTFIVWIQQMCLELMMPCESLNSVYMNMFSALHQCEYEHDASVHCEYETVSHNNDNNTVYCQLTAETAFATVCALVYSSMNIHMLIQGARRWIMFLTLSALKWFYRQSARPRTHANCPPPTPNYFRHPCMQFLLSLNKQHNFWSVD